MWTNLSNMMPVKWQVCGLPPSSSNPLSLLTFTAPARYWVQGPGSRIQGSKVSWKSPSVFRTHSFRHRRLLLSFIGIVRDKAYKQIESTYVCNSIDYVAYWLARSTPRHAASLRQSTGKIHYRFWLKNSTFFITANSLTSRISAGWEGVCLCLQRILKAVWSLQAAGEVLISDVCKSLGCHIQPPAAASNTFLNKEHYPQAVEGSLQLMTDLSKIVIEWVLVSVNLYFCSISAFKYVAKSILWGDASYWDEMRK